MGETVPREGQTSVTMHTYIVEKVTEEWNSHSARYKKKGIHSPTKLIEVWIEEKLAQG